MNKRTSAIVVVFLAAAVLATGCGRGKSAVKENSEITVSTAKVQMAALDQGTMVSGKLEALESANIVPKISGKVAAINVDIGSEVGAGDVLVRLDAQEMAAAVQLAEATLQKARESDMPSLENQARTNLAITETSYKNAEAEYQRSKALLDGGVISRQAFDQAEKAYLLAKSAYESARTNLEIVETSTISDTIRQAEAQLAQARANFANSIITAPISGVITARNINPGELASNSQPVVSLVGLDKLVVRLDIGENMINDLSKGSQVDVKVSAASPNSFKGTVTNISFAANPVSKAYPVKIEIENPGHVLKPGMFAEVMLNRGAGQCLTVPREAVVSDSGKSYIWVVDNGVVSKKEVSAGASDGVKTAITAGLSEGQEVVITGQEDLKEGLKVNVR